MDFSIRRLSINTTNARLEMQTFKSQVNLQQNHVKVEIESELPKVLIDQYECFAEAGIKNYKDLTYELVQRAKQNVLEYIGQTVEDGNRLAAIEQGGSPIVDMAERNAYPEHEFGMVTIPRSRPKIDVTGSLKIDFKPSELGIHNGVTIDVRLGSLETKYVPGNVQIDFKV